MARCHNVISDLYSSFRKMVRPVRTMIVAHIAMDEIVFVSRHLSMDSANFPATTKLPTTTRATTAAKGKYMRCSNIKSATGMKLEVGASSRKKEAPAKPTADL